MNDESNYYEDTSIFEGILEFNSPAGNIRAEKNGATVKIYIEDGNAFVYDCAVRLYNNAKFTCKNVYNALERLEDSLAAEQAV